MSVLYTPLPLELVMFTEDSTSPYQDIAIDGATLTVQPTATGMGKIVRINSTNPDHYLKPEFQPGQQISLSKLQI
ncbi:MAG: YlzJ-like family protein [Syntrophaceticus sp.]|nr:YlzJ-like family protein [Syntrophaceticus sp.]HBG21836.1 hypothetical protein [Peptococcaceae bacterium]MDD3313926.1 YlzJ-like family protein [Syntrophaceticus sp.]MDD4359004.1 YlzJ-like family protein [Syntrophaceticus sp.]MDD4782231.1 YlzJ-like family protein [Syntrophaceticus sp.]